MANNKWNDDEIDKLLHSMPKIEDHRSPDDILARLKEDERLKRKPAPKRRGWIPAIAAVAALLIIGLLVPSMFNDNKGSIEQAADLETQESMDLKRSMEKSAENDIENESESAHDNAEPAASMFTTRTGMESHLVLPDDMHGQYAFPIGMVYAANVIPVTFLLNEERVKADFPDTVPESVAMYNKYAANIPESELGFDEVHPYKGKISLSGDTVVNDLPDGHGYDTASATLYSYFNSAKETFRDHKLFQAADQKGEPAYLDQVGVSSPVSIERKLPYFKFTMPSGKIYLIPYENGNTETVVDALNAMKTPQNDVVETVIPSGVDFTAVEEDGIVMIRFSEKLNFDQLDPVSANEMIEGFMLTGSNYGEKIKLVNVGQEFFGKYDLTEPLPIPIGANPHIYPE